MPNMANSPTIRVNVENVFIPAFFVVGSVVTTCDGITAVVTGVVTAGVVSGASIL